MIEVPTKYIRMGTRSPGHVREGSRVRRATSRATLSATTTSRATPLAESLAFSSQTRTYLLLFIIIQQPHCLKMSANLQKIDRALQDLRDKRYRSIRQAARAHDIDKSSVAHRLRERRPRAQTYSSQQRLTPSQEIVLVHWLEDLQRQILPSNQ